MFCVLFSQTNLFAWTSEVSEDGCFCQLRGNVDDCSCSIDTIDYFNNEKIFPRLKSLVLKDYFRYFKVNLLRPCPFWADDGKCSLRNCDVETCPSEKVPHGLKGESIHKNKYTKEAQEEDKCHEDDDNLGKVNDTISDESYEDFEKWRSHDDQKDNFCEIDGENSADAEYVDLFLNPETFTGYSGHSARRIWKSIYKENCFKPGEGYGPYTTSKNLQAMCLEKRAFYRVISGLHASINMHVCSMYYTPGKNSLLPGKWGMNLPEFQRRFDPITTAGEGPQWLRNLYFVYLLELRALAKAAPYLEEEMLYTGNKQEDKEVAYAFREILNIIKSFPDHFDEKEMFAGDSKEAKKLMDEFKHHFRNISRIMDCVGCGKCKLWGKLQIQGLGTAFKILFSGENINRSVKKRNFHLTRMEIVTLVNAFAKLSESVNHVEEFRRMMKSHQEKPAS